MLVSTAPRLDGESGRAPSSADPVAAVPAARRRIVAPTWADSSPEPVAAEDPCAEAVPSRCQPVARAQSQDGSEACHLEHGRHNRV